MTKVKYLVEDIREELEDAKCYAEKYVEFKVENDSMYANKYREMAQDELKHANYIHEYAVNYINQLRQVYEPSEEMEDNWNRAHKMYVEKAAWIKTMLQM